MALAPVQKHDVVVSLVVRNSWEGGFPGGSVVKNPPANAEDAGDAGSIPGWGRSPWRRKWQPTPVLLPGKSHGQRSQVGCSPWGCKRVGHNLATTQQQQTTHGRLCVCVCSFSCVQLCYPWRIKGRAYNLYFDETRMHI